jgi:hypothetical protein
MNAYNNTNRENKDKKSCHEVKLWQSIQESAR